MMIHTASPGFVRLMNSSISQRRFVFLVLLSLLSVTLQKNKLVRQNTGPSFGCHTDNTSEIFLTSYESSKSG